MNSSDFVHLHCHSTYSLLEALPRPEEIVLRAKELGHTAVGLTDKGQTYGLFEFYKACKKHDIKPILGMDVYIAARTRTDKESGIDTKRYPLGLFAENLTGYNNLLQLASKASLEGMYYKPRVDAELMEKYGEGLIALTGPISGEVSQALLNGHKDQAIEKVKQYQQWFGKDSVYLELMDLPAVPGQSEVNQQLIELSKELNVPLVATCNSHYCTVDDVNAHDVLMCIQKNNRMDDPGRFTMRDSDHSMKSTEDMAKLFEHVPEALSNTKVIADRCTVEFPETEYQIPSFPLPQGVTDEDAYLREECEKGMINRYGENIPEEYRKRLDYELEVITKMGFSGYFLITSDFVRHAKSKGVTVGPGRGSACGSIVSYCMDIINIDPMEYDLLFERFLNPERVSMPDIDIDFADTKRDVVLEYVREKYGQENVVQICTFGTLAARAAIKDVGRAYGVPFVEMNELVKLISDRPGTKLKDALETSEMQSVYTSNDLYKKVIDVALKLEGKARHISVHACGVIITPEPAVNYTAIQRAPKDEHTIITQYSAHPLEDMGLLKMDFLGLSNLTVIQEALKLIKLTRGETIDLDGIAMDDTRTFTLFQAAKTTGVFQLESGGMKRYLKELKPTEFNDIIAMLALYRPGPMEMIPDYIKRKNDPSAIEYTVDELEPFLKDTYGIMVYQEQVQRVVQEIAGFSLGAGYLLIKAVGKKIPALLEAQREKFMEGAKANGHSEKVAKTIFDLIEPFSGYGFNKSHATGYARISYETAYLKANYPVEFLTALLSADSQNTDRVMIEIEEARSMGIKVLPPDVNESFSRFTALPKLDDPLKGSIRFGLAAIKGIGASSVDEIIAARGDSPFASMEDFAQRIPVKVLNKKTLEALAKAGAFDALEERAKILQNIEAIVAFAKSASDVTADQVSLFADADLNEAAIEWKPTEPASRTRSLQWEKEVMGLYISSHPLAGISNYLKKKGTPVATFTNKQMGKKVTIAGLPESIKTITTKRGDTMAIIMLEDCTGKMEATMFPKTYADYIEQLQKPDCILLIDGVLQERMGAKQLKVDSVKTASLEAVIKSAKEQNLFNEQEAEEGLKREEAVEEEVEVAPAEGNIEPYCITVPEGSPKLLLLEIKKILDAHPGTTPVQLTVGKQAMAIPLKVTVNGKLQDSIKELLKRA